MTVLETLEDNVVETSAICTGILNANHLLGCFICSGLLKEPLKLYIAFPAFAPWIVYVELWEVLQFNVSIVNSWVEYFKVSDV